MREPGNPSWLDEYREWLSRQDVVVPAQPEAELEPTEVEREWMTKFPGWKPKR